MAATLTDEASRQVWDLEDRQNWMLGRDAMADIPIDEPAFGETFAILHSSGTALASYSPAAGPPERRPGMQARWWIQHRRWGAHVASMRIGGLLIDHEEYFPMLTGDRVEVGARRFTFVEVNEPPFEAEPLVPFDWSRFQDSLENTLGQFANDAADAGQALRRFARHRANAHVIAGAFQTALVRHPVIATLVQPRDRVRAAAIRSIALRGLADLARSNAIDREATLLVVAPYREDAMPAVRISAEIAVASTEELPGLMPLLRAVDEALASRTGGVALEAADAVRLAGAIDPAVLARLCESAEGTARDATSSRRRRTAALVLGALREHRDARRAERPLAALLMDPSPIVRVAAIEAFASSPPAILGPIVLPMLRDRAADVMRAASRVLLNAMVSGHLEALREQEAALDASDIRRRADLSFEIALALRQRAAGR